MTASECVHLFTSSYFRWCKKDGSRANRSAVGENPMLHAHFTALCVIDTEVLAMEYSHSTEADLSWHAGIRCMCTCCDLFRSCDLDLTRWPSYYVKIHRMCKYELPTRSLLKVIIWQTDRHTESTEKINHAASQVVKYIGSVICIYHSLGQNKQNPSIHKHKLLHFYKNVLIWFIRWGPGLTTKSTLIRLVT